MNPREARALVAALPEAREHWLTETVAGMQAQAVWLTGSLGRGQADEWSDVDLIVVGGRRILMMPWLPRTIPGTALSAAATSAPCMTSVR